MADKKLMVNSTILIDYFRKTDKNNSPTEIVWQLKTKRKNKPDLFIAATAAIHGLTLDTLNTKHFIHIESLDLLIE